MDTEMDAAAAIDKLNAEIEDDGDDTELDDLALYSSEEEGGKNDVGGGGGGSDDDDAGTVNGDLGKSTEMDTGGQQAKEDGAEEDPSSPPFKTIIYHTTSHLDETTRDHVIAESGLLTAYGGHTLNFSDNGQTVICPKVDKARCRAFVRALRVAYKQIESTTRLAYEVDLEAEGDREVELPAGEAEEYMDYNEDQHLYYGPDEPKYEKTLAEKREEEPVAPILLPQYEMDHEPIITEKVADFIVKSEVKDIDDLFGINQPGNVDYVRDIALATKTRASLDHLSRVIHITGAKQKYVQEAVKRLHTLQETYMAGKLEKKVISLIHNGEARAVRCQMRPLSLFTYAKNQLLPFDWTQKPISAKNISVVVAMTYNTKDGKWFCDLPKAEPCEMPHEVVAKFIQKRKEFDRETKNPSVDVEALVRPPPVAATSINSALQHGDVYYAKRDRSAVIPKWAQNPNIPNSIRNNLQAVRTGPRTFENLNVKQTPGFKPTPGQDRYIPGLSAPETIEEDRESNGTARRSMGPPPAQRYMDNFGGWERATPAPPGRVDDPWAGSVPVAHPPDLKLEWTVDPSQDRSLLMSPSMQAENFPRLGSRTSGQSRRPSESGAPTWARVSRAPLEEPDQFPALPTTRTRPDYNRAPLQQSGGREFVALDGQNTYLNVLTTNLATTLDFLRGHRGQVNFKLDLGKILYRGNTSRDRIFPWDYLYNFIKDCDTSLSTRLTCSSADLALVDELVEPKPFQLNYIFSGLWREGPGGVPWKPYTLEFDPATWRVIRLVDRYDRALELNVNNLNQRWDWAWSIESAKILRHDVKPFNTFISKLKKSKNGFDLGFDAVPDFLTISDVHFRESSLRTLHRPEYQLENISVEVNRWQRMEIQKNTSPNISHPYRAIQPRETLQLSEDRSWYSISVMAPQWAKALAQNARLGIGQAADWDPKTILQIDERGVARTVTNLIKAAELLTRQLATVGATNGSMIAAACQSEMDRIDSIMTQVKEQAREGEIGMGSPMAVEVA